MENGRTHTITFLPMNARRVVTGGVTVLEAAKSAGVYIEAPCGGASAMASMMTHDGYVSYGGQHGGGGCGGCAVWLETEGGEKLILACEAKITRDMTVRVPVR